MNKDNAKDWDSASAINDPLTDLLKTGARALIQQAVEAELHAFLGEYVKITDLRGRQTVVRNGYLTEREIVMGVGNVTVKIPKVRDRFGGGIKFNSSLVPPYVRKAKRVEAALPELYLRGISTGDMQSALSVLLGDDAKGLSPVVVSRLKAQWSEDYLAWNWRDLSQERYVYVWADGIYSTLRGEVDRLCLLVIIGVNEQSEKCLLALSDGYRESKVSWLSVLQKLKAAPIPPAVIEGGMAAAGLLTWVMISKFLDRLPLYRLEQIAARDNVTLSRSTLADWVGRLGVAVQPLADRLIWHLLQGKCLHADEMPVPQLDPGRGKTKKAYL